MPWRTSSTSAPTASAIFAISLMKLIFVASMALAAYLVSSALRGSMNIILSWLRLNDSYMRRNSATVASERAPIMIRSGFSASATAEPSLRNSGFEHTSKGISAPRAASPAAIQSATLSAVPTGTVDLLTTTLRWVMCAAMPSATDITYCKSALPSAADGVPTQINRYSLASTASAVLSVKRSVFCAMPACTRSFRPGSKKGRSPP